MVGAILVSSLWVKSYFGGAVRSMPSTSSVRNRRERATRCRFLKTPTTWLLKSDCTATRAIEIPPGVSIDCNDCTILLAGHPERFESVGVRVNGGSVENLTIDGSGLESFCPYALAALVVSGPRTIAQTRVTSIRFDSECSNAVGIEVSAFAGDTVDLIDVEVADIDGTGLLLTGDGSVSLAGCSVQGAVVGLQAVNSVGVVISDSTFETSGVGIRASNGAQATIESDHQAWPTTEIGVTDWGIANIGNFTLAGFGVSSESVRVPAARLTDQESVSLRHLQLVSLEA